MQAEELNDGHSFLSFESKMTCNDTNEVPSFDQNTGQVVHSSMEDDKFEGINLDDDIERVELSSPSSGCSSEEDLNEFRDNFHLIKDQPEELKNWLLRIKDMQETICKKMQLERQGLPPPPPPAQPQPPPPKQSTPSRVMKYQDLPYMGEITLNHSKPRRGRKPKKADICHLIYKNYGTIISGTPNANNYLQQSKKAEKETLPPRTISSLLEKRLTQQESIKQPKKPVSEPINLCVRDLDQLKIRLTKNPDDTYSTKIKSEPASESESEATTPNGDRTTLNDEYGVPQFLINNGTNLWSPEDNLINSMTIPEQLMYYQKLASLGAARPPPDIIPIKPKPKEPRRPLPRIKPKENTTDEPEKQKRNLTVTEKSAKRKRSAIFIPPIPAENNTNPATEVSICKFKFTGGAKPSLQEKKMLSVDSGGNFRYYSGTGDKSMRGYEFFPRETLQQTANATQCSSTGAFLQTSGEKFFPIDEMNDKQVKSEFLLSPDLPPITAPPVPETSLRQKKRKTKKSLQREKLEQTFKEKGFLIQTQQLESAEGATYCKFRQLRKFTRYLFRSWKDYLPGNIREIQENGKEDQKDAMKT